MRNTLEDKLVESGEKTENDSKSVLRDTKLLFDSTQAEERKILVSIGLDNEIKQVENQREDLLIRKSNVEKLGKPVVHRKEIEKLCLDYRLYMRHPKQYMGTIPPDLGAELIKFQKEKNVAISSHSDHSSFYVISPPFMFESYQSPLKVLGNAFEIETEYQREKIRKKNEDPILVYKIDENYFAVIKSWGYNSTAVRRVYGFFTQAKVVSKLLLLFQFVLFYVMLKIANYQFFWWFNVVDAKDHDHPISVLGAILWLVIIGAFFIWTLSDWGWNVRRRIFNSVTIWNESHKQKRLKH